jgi:hypothetical protein
LFGIHSDERPDYTLDMDAESPAPTDTNSCQPSAPAFRVRAVWLLLRAFVLFLGVVLLALGGGLAVLLPDAGWMALALFTGVSLSGCWLAWVSIFGGRELVDRIFTKFLESLLGRLL